MRFSVLLAAMAVLLFSCQPAAKAADTAAAPAGTPSKADVSYDFGVLIANNLKATGVALDYDAFLNGIKDVMDKKTVKVTTEKAGQDVQAAIEAAQKKVAEDAAAAETKFLADNGKKDGVKTTASGLQYLVVSEGTGAKPKATDTVKVDYVGTLLDGTVFDSSIERKQPAVFPLDQVIPGWTEGIQLMTVGGKYKLFIPSALAYGPTGAGNGKIPGNSLLTFEVTLLSIEKPAAPAAPAAPSKK